MLTHVQYESCNNQIADALDAYGRAADLDPTNVHIKARLQLLQSQMAGSNQNNAPAPAPQPQDVHPQAYQAPGVGAPPAPQWGAHVPAAAPPQPPRHVAEWNRGIGELQSQAPVPAPAQVPVQAANGFDHRDAVRGSAIIQQPSPHQEQGRIFVESLRGQPATRSPKPTLVAASPYAQPHTLPQLANPPAPPHERGPGAPVFAGRGPLPAGVAAPAPNAPNGVPATVEARPAYRPFTPPGHIKPIRDERPPSPQSTYPHQAFHPGPSAPPQPSTGIAGGAPPPPSAIAAAEVAAREREDRPPSAMKRAREWEAEPGPAKKIANEESRARLDDQVSRHVTPPNRMSSPGEPRRNSSEARREELHRANENYHPSEAAHHPPTLPSIQDMPPHASGSSLPPMAEGSTPTSNGPSAGPPSAQTPVKEEPSRTEQPPSHEPPARKMDVDEDYDDDGEDEKKARAAKGSPHGSGPGNVNGNGVMSGGNQTPQKQEA